MYIKYLTKRIRMNKILTVLQHKHTHILNKYSNETNTIEVKTT